MAIQTAEKVRGWPQQTDAGLALGAVRTEMAVSRRRGVLRQRSPPR